MKDIHLYNTMTKSVELFTPINPEEVRMYHCGPTVYNRAHIGNLRPYIFADVLRRMFEFNGYKVKQVINITDVGHLVGEDNDDTGEDKVEKQAKKEGISAQDITQKYTDLFMEDLNLLGVDNSKIIFPKATAHIQEQLDMIQQLKNLGIAYEISDGIYYDTSKFPNYGALGNIDMQGLQEGARVTRNNDKKNPSDFALWKFSKPEDNRLQEWDSPWGRGFPGWHIECSAMSKKYLGEFFDIHTGGTDHVAIHHNNEIAQSQAVSGKSMANIWMHVAHILINGEKMSKSLGNIMHLDDLSVSPEAYRYWILTADHRTQINVTEEALEASQTAYTKLISRLATLPNNGTSIPSYIDEFTKHINNDIDTPQAIALIWTILKDDRVPDASKRATVIEFDAVLGLQLEKNIKKTIEDLIDPASIPEIQELLQKRESARLAQDFTKADAFREMIEDLGYEVKDTPAGPLIIKK